MEGDDVAGQLEDDSFKKRVEVLEQLIITVKRNGGRLPYADGESIFRSLGLALSDSNWEIRFKCIQLLQEIIPNLGDETDSYMSLVINRLLANIGDSKVTVRGKVVQALHSYMKHTRNLPSVFEALVTTGLDNENPAIKREMINSLPLLLTQEFITQDLSKIINSLAKKLLDTSTEDNLRDSSLSTLKKIENTIGEKSFSGYLNKLSMPLQKYYLQLSGKHDDAYYSETDDFHQRGNSMYPGALSNRNDSRKGYTEDTLEYGVVPSHILSRINDQKDFRTRAQAVEELKTLITSSTNEIPNNLLPHMVPFINFLSNLLDDSNFKIINVTLEIILSLVEKLDKNTKLFLKPLTAALLKRMGDNKVVVRQLVMSIVIKLMRTSSPQSVIDVLEDNLRHRNSRVRQETINFIIAALLTFPSYEFDLAAICQAVGPTLTDVKRAVRQAALECFATLAQGMGQGQLQPLVLAVDQVELSTDGEGLMAAVQARLARKQLPKITSEGLVEYATQTPTSATVRSSSAQQSADTEWIMAVSSTARSARSDSVDLESVNVSARSTPVVTEVSSPTSAPRRFLSAGRGRNKLPWEEDRDERTGPVNNFTSATSNQSFTVDDTPPQPREMWVGDREPQQRPIMSERAAAIVSERAAPKRRSTVMVLAAPEDPDASSSYTQLYQQKLRRQQVGGAPIRRVDATVCLNFLSTFYETEAKQSGIDEISRLDAIKELCNSSLVAFLSSFGLSVITNNLCGSSNILAADSVRSLETAPNLPTLGVHKVAADDDQQLFASNVPTLRPHSPFGFLVALLRLLLSLSRRHKDMIAVLLQPITQNKDILVYVKKTVSSSKSHLCSSHFTMPENLFHFFWLKCCILRPNLEMDVAHRAALALLSRLHFGDEHLAHDLLSTVIFSPSFISEAEDVQLTSQALTNLKLSETLHLKSATQEDINVSQSRLLQETYKSLNLIRAHYLMAFCSMEKAARSSRNVYLGNCPDVLSLLVRNPDESLMPKDWVFMPLIQIYNSISQRGPLEDKNLPSQTIAKVTSVLQWTYLLEILRPLEMDRMSVALRLSRIFCAFIAGADLFLEKPVHQYLAGLIRVLSSQMLLDKMDLDEKIPGITSFYDLYQEFLDHYEAVSFGDPVFGLFVLLPLQQKHSPLLRRAIWEERRKMLRTLRVPLEEMLIPVQNFLYPEETDQRLLQLYSTALAANAVFPTWSPMLYLMAVHHLNRFLYTSQDDGNHSLRQNLWKQILASRDKVSDVIYYKQYNPDCKHGLELYDQLPSNRQKLLDSQMHAAFVQPSA
ncbi:TOG array regulator of axonemal microtubules protein 1 [Bulinus truncatus]|nr:TOG array regulator of axonemal microtubules protein 1 [Bulinus truncatus]